MRLRRHAEIIGHVQLASVPDRTELDDGKINLVRVLRTLDAIGYQGLIGPEYKPRADTTIVLSWIDRIDPA
ncbi:MULTISPECIES: TIM barrel protein [unclassified Sinorhizobium]|uniref:TIM barrel protein n=1 Tax=unclassified Sinorhizobium TaxID=2613772 RepID=UPI0035253D15